MLSRGLSISLPVLGDPIAVGLSKPVPQPAALTCSAASQLNGVTPFDIPPPAVPAGQPPSRPQGLWAYTFLEYGGM